MDIFYTKGCDHKSDSNEEEYIFSPEGEKQSRRRYILSLSKKTIKMYQTTFGIGLVIKSIKDPWFTRRGRYHPCRQEYIDGMTVETYHSICMILYILNCNDDYEKKYVNDFKNFLKTHRFYKNFSFELHNE